MSKGEAAAILVIGAIAALRALRWVDVYFRRRRLRMIRSYRAWRAAMHRALERDDLDEAERLNTLSLRQICRIKKLSS